MKKVVALLLALVMVFALCACGGGQTQTGPGPAQNPTDNAGGEQSGGEQSGGEQSGGSNELAGTYDITVWAPDAAVELTKQQVADFNSSNEFGITFNVTVEPVSEAEAANNVITDVDAAGDLFFFSQDQLSRMVLAGGLNKLGQGAAATVTELNDAGSLIAATSGSDLYAYPLTADNGYFMYYDKSVIPEDHIDSLEDILADCEAAGKLFAMENNTSAWYIVAWFFATGCHSDWTFDEAGKATGFDDDFNSANGVIAAKGMQKLLNSPANLSSSDVASFANGAAVVVSGTWALSDAQKILGENLGAADLPSFTVDGKSYHMGSYNGCKLLGVKPQSDATRAAALNQLALYLTNYDCQMARFNEFGWGPSNLQAMADPAVTNIALEALSAQNAYATPQPNIPTAWWDIAKVIADDVKAAGDDDAAIQAALDKYESSVQASLAG